jgi:hypothetical protein
MTNSQSDRLDMMKEVISYIEGTNTISSTRPGLIAGKTNLKDNVVAPIETKAGKQSSATGGAYDDKNELQETLCQQLYAVTSGTKAFAASINNNTLQEQMNYSITELRRIGDETIVPFTENMVTLVTPHLGAALTGFGVDATAMSDLDTAKTNFSGKKTAGRDATVDKATQTVGLPPLFTLGTKILREIMDPVAATLKLTQSDWYNGYINARKVINTGGGTTALDGDVFEAGTTTGIYNASVSAIAEDGTKTVVKTDVNGHYKFVPIKRGTYIITFTHPSHTDLTLAAFIIKQGQTVTKNVFLEKK